MRLHAPHIFHMACIFMNPRTNVFLAKTDAYFWSQRAAYLSPGRHNLKQMELQAARFNSAASFRCPAGELHPWGNLLTLWWKLMWHPLSPSGGTHHPTNKELLTRVTSQITSGQLCRHRPCLYLGGSFGSRVVSEQMREDREWSRQGRESKASKDFRGQIRTPSPPPAPRNYYSYSPIICSFVAEQGSVPGNPALHRSGPGQSTQWATYQ